MKSDAEATLDHLKSHATDTSRQIAAMVRAVDQDNAYIGVLSTTEQCAVCLVLNRPDLAKKYYGTLLECADRVGPEWLAASLFVLQNGWNDPTDDDKPKRPKPSAITRDEFAALTENERNKAR